MFIEGPITHTHLSEAIEQMQQDEALGAYTIFMGQIRADVINGKKVSHISYSAYEPMALNVLNEIINSAHDSYEIKKIVLLHSLGAVEVGRASLMIVVGAAHRKACLKAQDYILESIKKEVPVFGKEVFEQGDFVWKKNK